MTSGKINLYYYPVEKGEANQGLALVLFTRRNIHERNKNQGIKSGADEASGRSNAEHIEGINENYICMLKLCNNEFSVMVYIRKVLCSDDILECLYSNDESGRE